MTRLRTVATSDDPTVSDCDFAEECHRQLDKMLSKGITALVLLGDLADSANKPPIARAVPDSYAVRYGMVKLACKNLAEDEE